MQIDTFFKYIRYELNLSTHTVSSYKKDIEQFAEFLASDVDSFDATSVTINDIRAWMVALAKVGDSMRTIRRKIQSLRALYKFLMKKGIVTVNPADEIEMAKYPKSLPSYIRREKMDELLSMGVDDSDFEAVRDRLIILLLYSTGIRRAELIGLRDVDVDIATCQIKVQGKRNKDRIIPFGNEMRGSIVEYKKLRKELMLDCCELFFIRPSGEPLYPSLVYNVVHSQLASVGGGGKMSPHVLRHTFASAMLNNGAQLNSVKEILGHESLAATQVYTHITFSELKQNYKLAHPRAIKKGG